MSTIIIAMNAKNKREQKARHQRSYRAGFCRVCIHSQKSLQYGVICSLTDKIADFDKECPAFALDATVIEKAKQKHKEYLDEHYLIYTNSIVKMVTHRNYSITRKEEIETYTASKKTSFRESDFSDLGFFIFFGTAIFMSFFYFLFNIDQPEALLFTLGSIIGCAVYGHRYLNKDYKVKIKIVEEGIQTDFTFLAWSEILDYAILNEYQHGGDQGRNVSTLLVFTISGNVRHIPLNNLETGVGSIPKTILDHHKLYSHNS